MYMKRIREFISYLISKDDLVIKAFVQIIVMIVAIASMMLLTMIFLNMSLLYTVAKWAVYALISVAVVGALLVIIFAPIKIVFYFIEYKSRKN